MSEALPPRRDTAAALVAWGNAWLGGHVGLDEAVDAVERAACPQVVGGLPDDPADMPLRRALAALRVAGMRTLRLALPAPGDPLGLTGPPELNAAALDAGEAVLVGLPDGPLGLVPAEDRRGSSYVGIRWRCYRSRPGRLGLAPIPAGWKPVGSLVPCRWTSRQHLARRAPGRRATEPADRGAPRGGAGHRVRGPGGLAR